VVAFLRDLADERQVSASTQAQALAALLFLYREVLGRPLQMAGLVPRGRGVSRIPVVLAGQRRVNSWHSCRGCITW
jgi:hypothetical protein